MPHDLTSANQADGDEVDLVAMLDELHRLYGVHVSHHRLWSCLASKRAPGRRVGSRWRARRSDAPLIGEALGIAIAGESSVPPSPALPAAA